MHAGGLRYTGGSGLGGSGGRWKPVGHQPVARKLGGSGTEIFSDSGESSAHEEAQAAGNGHANGMDTADEGDTDTAAWSLYATPDAADGDTFGATATLHARVGAASSPIEMLC